MTDSREVGAAKEMAFRFAREGTRRTETIDSFWARLSEDKREFFHHAVAAALSAADAHDLAAGTLRVTREQFERWYHVEVGIPQVPEDQKYLDEQWNALARVVRGD